MASIATTTSTTEMAQPSVPIFAAGAVVQAGSKTKLHGRAFYESIGSPKHIIAPMVDQSEFVSCRAPVANPF
jgi:tRNA-dihydrouridine synthase 1